MCHHFVASNGESERIGGSTSQIPFELEGTGSAEEPRRETTEEISLCKKKGKYVEMSDALLHRNQMSKPSGAL